MNNKIYLAGPDVFRQNHIEYFNDIKILCAKYGFEGLSPFDNENFDGELFSKEHSINIFKSNINMIEKCEYVFANLIPFRGACVDDGTSWEVAYAYSLNKTIYGYTKYYDKKLKEITYNASIKNKNTNFLIEKQFFPNIESFSNNCVNLMLQESIELSGGKILESFEECLINLTNKRKYETTT